MSDELSDLAPGSVAVMRVGYGCGSHRLVVVERVTETQIVAGGIRFRRGFGPDDVTWCEVRADVLQIIGEVRP